MPDRDRYYIEHGDRTNTFHFRQNKKQEEKDDLFLFLINLDKKKWRQGGTFSTKMYESRGETALQGSWWGLCWLISENI